VVGNAGLELSRESYSLNWLGKSYARLLANEYPRTLLKEDKTHNAQEPHKTSENLLIKGDNLEVLKHLSNAYSEQVKMIYIDPPYNTGGDGFVYADDRKFTPQELVRLAGVELDEAKRILEFTASKANSHSAWLTFMYPRLYVARELLREDGVIFISIDDNEVAQLKLLCDEVFGEENFQSNISWQKRYTRSNNTIDFTTVIEHILVYSKSNQFVVNLLPRTEETDARYSNPDNDSRGVWKGASFLNPATPTERPNLAYPIINPYTNKTTYPTKNAWRREKSEFEKLQNDNRLYWGKDKEQSIPSIKMFLSEARGLTPINFWEHTYAGNTDEGTNNLFELFNKKLFNNPKPIKLIKRILEHSSEKDSFILDFFAGSGTTAHAVMALNKEDGGNRKYITVQIDEKTDEKSEAYKAGYKSIFEITKARIEKASEALGDESGFKVYETLPMFEGYLDELDELSDETKLFNGAELGDEELEAFLTTWKAYDGVQLHERLEAVDLAGYRAYGFGKLLYFMDKGFNIEVLQAFIAKLDDEVAFVPTKLVLFGYNFESRHQREFKEALENYKNKKNIELDLEIRY